MGDIANLKYESTRASTNILLLAIIVAIACLHCRTGGIAFALRIAVAFAGLHCRGGGIGFALRIAVAFACLPQFPFGGTRVLRLPHPPLVPHGNAPGGGNAKGG